jgi:hypothetical protein
MQIQDSNILLSGQHQTTERREVKASLNFWSGDAGQPATTTAVVLDKVTLSTQAQQLEFSQKAEATGSTGDATTDPNQQMLASLVERMTGNKIRIFSAQDAAPTASPPDSQTAPQSSAGYGLDYNYHETLYQSEQTTLSAQGVIKTADGKEINFSLKLEVSREYLDQTDVSVHMGDATPQTKDPLVVNFNGLAAQLTETKFAFDINGKADGISFPKPGRGFFALDKNGDGKVGNTSQLVDSASGDGLQKLAAQSQGHDNSAFAKLKLLIKDSQGLDILASLADKGIGARYQGRAATPPNLPGAPSAVDGQAKSSGIYAKEDGSAGSAQQVDLSV